jgi:hypothetical protein
MRGWLAVGAVVLGLLALASCAPRAVPPPLSADEIAGTLGSRRMAIPVALSSSRAAPAPQYTLRDVQEVSAAGRTRYRANMILPGGQTLDAVTAALAAAARQLLADCPSAQAVMVFGYRNVSETSAPNNTVGKAQISRDGRGWAGDGKFDAGQDNNQIHLVVGGVYPADSRLVMVPR